MSNYREKALSLIALELAQGDMGIYPQSISGGENAYEQRTDWMEGWNACIMALSKKESAINKWFREIPQEHKPKIEDLILDGILEINVEGDNISLWVLCNDLFFWACSDGENFEFSDLPDLFKALEESPKNGAILWVCRKRQMRPQKPYYKYFDEHERTLFNATGNERKD